MVTVAYVYKNFTLRETKTRTRSALEENEGHRPTPVVDAEVEAVAVVDAEVKAEIDVDATKQIQDTSDLCIV